MEEAKNKITSKQLMTLIVSAQVGIGIFSMPNQFANEVGHNGWICILLSCIISIGLTILLVKLMEKYGDKSLYEINNILYGKYIGNTMNMLIAVYMFIKASQAVRYFTEVIQINVLRITPPLVISFIIIIPSIYLSWYGLKYICRFSHLIYVSMFMILLLFIRSLKYVKPVFLMPVAVPAVPEALHSMLATAYIFLPFSNFAVLYPMITDKKGVFKYVAAANIVTALFSAWVVVTVTGFFGENMVKHLIFPLYSLAQAYVAPIFERIDLFFLAIWFPALGMSLRMYFYTSYDSITRLFKTRRNMLPLAVLVPLLLAASRLPRDYTQLNSFSSLTDNMGMPLLFGLAIIDYILSFIIKKQ